MKNLVIVAETESSSAELLRRLPLPHGYGLMARCQTHGRGRQGRTWQSREGDLAASFWLSRLGEPVTVLPLVAGIAVLDALAHLPCGHALAARCKWPNDIRIHGRKLAGILAMYQPESRSVVLGIGVNLVGTPSDFASLERPATSVLCETGQRVAPESLFCGIALHLSRRLRQWRRDGFAPLREEWLARCDHLGKAVSVHCPDSSTVSGITEGIGPSGELILNCDGRIRALLCGDVESSGQKSA